MSFLERIECAVTPLIHAPLFNACEFHIGRLGFCGLIPGSSFAINEGLRELEMLDPYLNMDRFASCHGRGGYSGSGGGYGDGGGGGGGYGDGGYGDGDGDGSDSSGAPLGPGEKVQAKQLFDYFKEQGFGAGQAAGILGNMLTESGFRTDAYNAGEGAIGLCQWEGGRRGELERFAANIGRAVTDWKTQADFVIHELTGSESGALENLKSSRSPSEAARVFQSQYERSAALTNRASNAEEIYNELA
jgi:hypothetical protein